MNSETTLSTSQQRHVIVLERHGVTHLTMYTVTDGVVRIVTAMGEAHGPAHGDPQGEALRLLNRLVETFERGLLSRPSIAPLTNHGGASS